jgi:two-component system chemotaxis sensor kinase CheA
MESEIWNFNMKELHEYFSVETIKKLKSLSEDLQSAETLSDADRRELFRTLHTVKGSSQTFGFAASSRLAHELENLFSVAKSEEISITETFKNLFVEGIDLLIASLEQKNFEIPAAFVEKIHAVVPASFEKPDSSETLLPEIPNQIVSQLSSQEKIALAAALENGKSIYGLEVGFDSANFAVEFKNFQKVLSESSEIIATLPSLKFNAQRKIGFQIIFASFLRTGQVQKIAERNAAEVILDTSETIFSNDLQGVLSQAARHGETIAKKFGKKIQFEVSADEIKLSPEKLKLIFDVLTHLTRNAVDHAIEAEGKIKIDVGIEENTLKLSVSDDGRGIDLTKVKTKAIEKNLISAAENLTGQETLDLIFLPEFSTASELTEISGRGIGLDAVKDAVEKANGKINVKSQSGHGTTFEIFLSKDEK